MSADEGQRRVAELSPRTFGTFPRELSSRRRTLPIVVDELSGVWERPMSIAMGTTARPQQRYDHRVGMGEVYEAEQIRAGRLQDIDDLKLPRIAAFTAATTRSMCCEESAIADSR